jgi:Phosphotransferase enzyme family
MGSKTVRWSQFMIDLLDCSFSRVSWMQFQEGLKGPAGWTIIHGDYHPANIMVRRGTNELVLLDWEMVGIGSGPQDLGQYVISHLAPADRRLVEMDALRRYYEELTSIDKSIVSWDVCLDEYRQGGVCRWVWLVAYIADVCPDNMTQFFVDQLEAFAEDHGKKLFVVSCLNSK